MQAGSRGGGAADAADRQIVVAIPCLLRGGTEHQTISMVQALTEAGWRPTVWVYFEVDPGVESELRALSVQVRRFDWPRSNSLPWLVVKLARELRRERPNLVHVQYMAPGLAPVCAARLAGVPRIVATVHHLPPVVRRARAFRLFRWADQWCDRVVFVSEAARRAWSDGACVRGTPSARHVVIHNPAPFLQVEPRSEVAAEVVGDRGPVVIGAVARLVALKGIDVLLDALSRLERGSWCARIVGDGPEEAPLRAMATRLGIDDRVVWLGERTRDETIRALRGMDVVVVPSREEGLGLVALEAMACGRPVIASDVGGLTEVVVPEETGLLVPRGDPESLARALRHLVGSPALRNSMGRRGLERARASFGWQSYRTAVHRVHASLLGASVQDATASWGVGWSSEAE